MPRVTRYIVVREGIGVDDVIGERVPVLDEDHLPGNDIARLMAGSERPPLTLDLIEFTVKLMRVTSGKMRNVDDREMDFAFQEDAQIVYDRIPGDPYNLDPSGDGFACASLPSRNE